MRSRIMAWTLALAVIPATSLAESDFHLGVDVGRTRLEASTGALLFGLDPDKRSGHDTGYRLRLGYHFSRYVALEIGYAHLGEIEATDVDGSCSLLPDPCTYTIRSRTRGPFANVVGTWPFVDRWSAEARLGLMHAQVSSREEVSGASAQRTSEENGALLYGIGVSYHVGPSAAISLDVVEYEGMELGLGLSSLAFFDLGSSRMVSLGFTWRFR